MEAGNEELDAMQASRATIWSWPEFGDAFSLLNNIGIMKNYNLL